MIKPSIFRLLLILIATTFSTSVSAFDARIGILSSYGFDQGFGWGHGVEAEIMHSSGLSFGLRYTEYKDGLYHFKQNSRFAQIDRHLPIETSQAGFTVSYDYSFNDSFSIGSAVAYMRTDEDFVSYALLPNDGTRRITESRSDWVVVPAIRAAWLFDRVSIRIEVFYIELDEYVTGLPAAPDNLVYVKRSTYGVSLGVGYRF